MDKPYLYTGKLLCPTCGTTDLVALFSDGPNPPELAGSHSVRWCKNGHVCIVGNGYGQEVYSFKKERIYLHDKEISAFETTECALAAVIQELNSKGLSTGWWSFRDTEVTIDTVDSLSRTMRDKGGAAYEYPIYVGNGTFTAKLLKGAN